MQIVISLAGVLVMIAAASLLSFMKTKPRHSDDALGGGIEWEDTCDAWATSSDDGQEPKRPAFREAAASRDPSRRRPA